MEYNYIIEYADRRSNSVKVVGGISELLDTLTTLILKDIEIPIFWVFNSYTREYIPTETLNKFLAGHTQANYLKMQQYFNVPLGE